MVEFIYGVCRFWFIFFRRAEIREQMFDESGSWYYARVPSVCRDLFAVPGLAIVLIVSHLVPDYVILNFHAGRRRAGGRDATWLLSLNILRASWPSVAILPRRIIIQMQTQKILPCDVVFSVQRISLFAFRNSRMVYVCLSHTRKIWMKNR